MTSPEQGTSRSVRVPQPAPSDSHSEMIAALIRELLQATVDGSIRWQATESTSESVGPRYEVDLDSGNIEVGSIDNDGITPFDLRVYSAGPPYTLVERVSGRDERHFNDMLGDLYEAAGRNARGVEATVRGLIAELARLRQGE